MMKKEKTTLARRIALGLVIGSVMVSTGLAYAGTTVNIGEDTNVDTAAGSSTEIEVSDCTMNVTGGAITSKLFGGKSDTGNVKNNTININGGTFSYTAILYGGYVAQASGEATGNCVRITGGTFNDTDVIGGNGQNNVTQNEVSIDTDTGTFSYIYGGSATKGTASENKVTIYSGMTNYVYGAYSSNGEVKKNIVYYHDGTNESNIYGGYGGGNATENEVYIYGGTFSNSDIYGAYTSNSSTATAATKNVVTITDGTFDKDAIVYGAYATYNANYNEVYLGTKTKALNTNTAVFNDIYGGSAANGTASNNKVSIYGGQHADIYGGDSSKGSETSHNEITVIGASIGTHARIYGGHIYMSESRSNPTAEGNSVTITNCFINGLESIYGGYIASSLYSESKAIGNHVTIENLTEGSIALSIIGGSANIANNNEVTVNSGRWEYVCGGDGGNSATNNTVTIDGAKVDDSVVGGFSYNSAVGNTVNIYSGDLTAADVYGGQSYSISGTYGTYGGAKQANVLNFGTATKAYSGSIKSLQGFDTIHFNSVDWQKDSTVISTNSLALNPNDNGTAITVGAINIAQGDLLKHGDLLTLITSTSEISGNLDETNSTVKANVNESIARTYSNTDFIISMSDDKQNINLTFDGDDMSVATRNDQVLVLGESRAAAMAFTNQGAELIELSIDALRRTKADEDMQVFAAAYGNATEYETGSHVKVNGWSGIVGVGKKHDSGLSYGAFFENGTGNYSTHNVLDGEYMRGDGEATYNGGGLFVRKDNQNGLYVEGALRAGNLSNTLDRAVRSGADLVGYDVNTLYYGAQIGVGKIIPVGKNSLDVYGKFLYTHHDSERFDIAGTDMYFDSVTSQRLRLGARMNHAQTDKLSLYYGAAWEYEFDGDAQDKVDRFDLDTPSLEGSTVIGELGMNYKATDKWTIDLNFRGYGGQRDGYSGSAHVNYTF